MRKVTFGLIMFCVLFLAACGGKKTDFIEGKYEYFLGNGDRSLTLSILEYDKGKIGIMIKDDYSTSFAKMDISISDTDTIVSFTLPEGRNIKPRHRNLLQKQKISMEGEGLFKHLIFHFAVVDFVQYADIDKEEIKPFKLGMMALFKED